MKLLERDDIWIGDTGASNHTSFSNAGSKNERESQMLSKGIMGDEIKPGLEMDLECTHCDKFGNEVMDITLDSVGHMKGSNYNLCSLTRMMQKGWKLQGDKKAITMTKNGMSINFDIVIPTTKGALYCACFKRKRANGEVHGAALGEGTEMNINRAHTLLGHKSEDSTRKTAKQLGWRITRGSLKPCESCAISKAKQKNVPKERSNDDDVKTPNELWHHDISTIKVPKKVKGVVISKPVWHLTVDKATGLKVSAFYTAKNKMIEPMCERMHKMKQLCKPVQRVRQDNAGENKKLKKRCKSADWKLDTEFEFTAKETPQQNSIAETGFTHLAAMSRSMLNAARVPIKQRYRLFPEAALTSTKLDWLSVAEVNGVVKTRIEHYGSEIPHFAKHLHTWGEAGTVKTGKDGKVGDRGVTCMLIGYANDHEGNVFRMFNPNTNRVTETRDVTWLGRMYYSEELDEETKLLPEVCLQRPANVVEDPEDEDLVLNGATTAESEEREGNANTSDAQDSSSQQLESTVESTVETEQQPTVEQQEFLDRLDDSEDWVAHTTRTGRKTGRKSGLYDPTTGKSVSFKLGAVQNYFASLAELDNDEVHLDLEVSNGYVEYHNVGAGVGGGFENTNQLKPMKYDEAVSGPDGEEWREEIENEHNRMLKNKVFDVVERSELPPGTKPIDSTWACKLKSNGTRRGRLNARGFKQIEGQHFDGSSIHAPVTNAATIRIVLTLMLMAGWIGNVVDVKGAFLHGEFNEGEEIYMKVPQGWEHHYSSTKVLRLRRCLYGLRQAAMAFWKQLLQCMKSMKMKRSTADPCLYFKWTAAGLVM